MLTHADKDAAMELCARNPADNVFVAARIVDADLDGPGGTLVGYEEEGQLISLCWASANVVPVETTAATRGPLAERVRKWNRHAASLLGPSDQTLDLWKNLSPHWGPSRGLRPIQPHLSTSTPPSAHGIIGDARVRPARVDEVDIVLPASTHMFTAEIGYPPYRGSARPYRALLLKLIERGHTYVIVEDGEVVFKADVGSVGLGCAQIQGVWLAPHLRGHGLGTAAMASVVEHVLADIAPTATLYVNDYNTVAMATYERIGMTRIGTFATVLL